MNVPYIYLLQFSWTTMSKGKGAKTFHGTHVKQQPYQARPQSPGESPTLFRTVMWDRSLTSLLNHDRKDAGNGNYSLSSSSEKNRKFNLMQMS